MHMQDTFANSNFYFMQVQKTVNHLLIMLITFSMLPAIFVSIDISAKLLKPSMLAISFLKKERRKSSKSS